MIKKILGILLFVALTFTSNAQIYTKVNGYGYQWTRGLFDSTLHIPIGNLLRSNVNRAGALVYNTADSSVYTWTGTQWIKLGGGGSVVSVGTNNGTGITGGPITTSGTLAIDTFRISTRAWRQKGVDSLQANINLKLNISDTAAMLSPYLRKVDTTAMLQNYVNNVGYGLDKSGQVVSVDTLEMSTRAWRQKGIDSVAALINSNVSGTTNYVSKFTGTNTIGNSQIFDNGTNVGVGTTSPTQKLDVNGDASFNGVRVGRGASNSVVNTVVGNNSMTNVTSGTDNTAMGYGALAALTSGIKNTSMGINSLTANTSGSENIAIGHRALETNTSGGNNIAIGSESILFTTTGGFNVGVGSGAIAYNTTGTYNTALGYSAGKNPVNAGQFNQTGTNNVYIGRDTRAAGNGNNTNEIVIGAQADGNGSNSVTLGNGSITKTILRANVGVGTTAPDSALTVVNGALFQRGVRMSGLPSAPGTKALRINANGTLSIADTLVDAGGTVTSVATNTATGITGGTITTSGTLAIDTTLISTRLWRQKGIDSIVNNFVPYTGATTTVDLGTNLISSGTSQIVGNNSTSGGYLGFKQFSSSSSGGSGLTSISALSTNTLVLNFSQGAGVIKGVYLDATSISNNSAYTYNFPNKGGTFALLDDVTGAISGTTNYIPKFTGANSLGNSNLYESSGNIGLGTTSPVSYSGYNVLTIAGSTNGGVLAIRNPSGFGLNLSATGNAATIDAIDNTAPMVFTTNSSERMRITSSGNLGIGTSSPDAILHIAKSNSGGIGGQLVIDNPASDALNNAVEISFLTASGASGTGIRNARIQAVQQNASTGAANLQFWTWNGNTDAERMRLDASGNLGLGVTPSAWGTNDKAIEIGGSNSSTFTGLNVTSIGKNAYFDGTNWIYKQSGVHSSLYAQSYLGNHAWYLGGTGTAGNAISFTQAMTLDASGRLLIGLTSSSSDPANLQVNGASPTNAYNAQIQVRSSTNNTNDESRIAFFHSTHGSAYIESIYESSGYANLSFATRGGGAPTERMRITSSGNVGIGTSSPAYKLDVAGAINMGLNQLFTADGYKMHYRNSTVNITFSGTSNWQVNNNADNKALLTVLDGGNVGIGTTSPTVKLQVSDGTTSAQINPSGGVAYFGTVTNHPAAFSTNGSERMRITSGGEVLIGTTSIGVMTLGSKSLQVNDEIISRGTKAGLFFEDRSNTVTATTNWYGWYASGGTIYLYNGASNIASINSSTGVYTALSDSTQKKDFETSTLGLNAIIGLKPTLYRMKSESDTTTKHLGFLAQEVKDYIPQAYVENGNFIGLNYNAIIPVLVNAIKELKAEIETLKNK